MKKEHKYAQVFRWLADGLLNEIQIRRITTGWMFLRDRNEIVNDEILRGVGDYEFRLKPSTITVNGREIVAGESEAPADGTMYWTPVFLYSDLVDDYRWLSDDCDLSLLQKGLVHLTKENAIAHAKAMLGVD